MATKSRSPLVAAEAFQPVVDAFASDRRVTAGLMMASFGLRLNGKIFAMYVRDAFVAKLPKARVDELVAAGTGTNFEPGEGRPMKEWISIQGDEDLWVDLAREAYRFVGSAPKPKPKATRRRASSASSPRRSR